jgi:hypothetical protein
LRAQREELRKVKAFAAENISRKCLREQDKPNKYQSRYHCNTGSVLFIFTFFALRAASAAARAAAASAALFLPADRNYREHNEQGDNGYYNKINGFHAIRLPI